VLFVLQSKSAIAVIYGPSDIPRLHPQQLDRDRQDSLKRTKEKEVKGIGRVIPGAATAAALCLFLLALIFSSCLPSTAYAFDEDTHYYLKYYLLRKVGFAKCEAAIIAKADQSTDFGDTAAGFAYDHNNPGWHALASKSANDARQTQLWDRAKNALGESTLEKKLIPFGQFLHFLEDRTTHEGYGWFFGHFFKGHKVDYLSYYRPATIESAVENWSDSMKEFFRLLHPGQEPNPVTWDSVKDTVGKVRNANPTPTFGSSPDSTGEGKARDIINDALRNEIDPNEYIQPSTNYKFDKDGSLIGMIPQQKFSFSSEALACNNVTILNAIAVIENSPYFQYHPEASVAVQALHNFAEEQEAIDPSINSLRDAITNMTGLAEDDVNVLDETTHISLLMLDCDFERESHVLYLRSMKYLSGAGVKMQLAYDSVALAEPEIEKMEANPTAVNFELLSDNLRNAWAYLTDAEFEALSAGPVGGGIAELPDVAQAPASQSASSASSGPPYAAVAGGLAAVALALTAGGWYARKRLLR
jgi:hypothetical protein